MTFSPCGCPPTWRTASADVRRHAVGRSAGLSGWRSMRRLQPRIGERGNAETNRAGRWQAARLGKVRMSEASLTRSPATVRSFQRPADKEHTPSYAMYLIRRAIAVSPAVETHAEVTVLWALADYMSNKGDNMYAAVDTIARTARL